MALNDDTEALLLAYVYGELSASDARDFERRMDAGTPEAAELRAEVESLRASRELFGTDAAFGLRTGVDVPPAHLVDAIMNAEKLSRLPAVRDAALARVAPPVDKSFTAKLSRWLLGGGLAVGAAAALFIVVTQGAQEPAMSEAAQVNAPAVDVPKAEEKVAAAPAPMEAPPPNASSNAPLGGVFGDTGDSLERNGVSDNKRADVGLADGRLADKVGDMGGEAGNATRFRNGGAVAGADLANEEDAPDTAAMHAALAKQPTVEGALKAGDAQGPSALGRADAEKGFKPAGAEAEAKLQQDRAPRDESVATKAKEAAKESLSLKREATKSPEPKTELKAAPKNDDGFSFDSLFGTKRPPKPLPKPEPRPDVKADAKADKNAELDEKSITLRDGEKAGMRSSVGADKDTRGFAGGGGVATGAAPGSGSSTAGTTGTTGTTSLGASAGPRATPSATVPMTPPADAPSRAMSPPPPPAPVTSPAKSKPNVVADAKPVAESADDDEVAAPPKVISREALEEQRRNVRKKSSVSGKSIGAETERAKRLEQANIALASAQRELAGKRWLSGFDQMALAESLDLDRALGATPLVGQMRALVELKRPVDAARVARRLGRWDVKAYDVVPGLLLGAQIAEQIGDDRLARELWTRLLEAPTEKAKARAALDRIEGAKALRRQHYDSDAAAAPAAAAPAESESAKE